MSINDESFLEGGVTISNFVAVEKHEQKNYLLVTKDLLIMLMVHYLSMFLLLHGEPIAYRQCFVRCISSNS